MLTVKNLQFTRNHQILFEGLNFSLSPGSALQLCGPNGVGKSTALKILAGLSPARRGSIFFDQIKQANLGKFSKYLGHELALHPQLSIWENLSFYASLLGEPKDQIAIACDFFNLMPIKNQQIHTLSAGQQHRCQLAKLLLGKASIWLLDEPFTALDQANVKKLLNLFSAFLDKKGMIIFTSHHPLIEKNLNLICYFMKDFFTAPLSYQQE